MTVVPGSGIVYSYLVLLWVSATIVEVPLVWSLGGQKRHQFWPHGERAWTVAHQAANLRTFVEFFQLHMSIHVRRQPTIYQNCTQD